MVKITKELQDTVRELGTKTVYFDKNGRHYFNVHSLIEKKGSDKKNLYGSGVYSHHQIIPGHNPEGIKEQVAIGDKNTLIVEQVSGDDILAYEVKPEGDSILAKVAGMNEEEIAALKEILLGGKPAAKAPLKITPVSTKTEEIEEEAAEEEEG